MQCGIERSGNNDLYAGVNLAHAQSVTELRGKRCVSFSVKLITRIEIPVCAITYVFMHSICG